MRGVAGLESRLLQLFGPGWETVKLQAVRFVAQDRYLDTIGLARGCALVIPADKLSPANLLHSLDLDLAHEYAHCLLFNRQVLDRSLSDRHKAEASIYFGEGGGRLDLNSLSDRNLARTFMWSLETGVNNPYISGLQSGYFHHGAFADWLYQEFGSDDHLPDYLDGQLFLYSFELITEKVAGLLAPPTGRQGRQLREHLEESFRSIRHEKIADTYCLPFAALKRVHAEKTGNGDLLHYLNNRKFAGSPYEELCAALSELWDKISLRTV
jgi:hypothetical protein